MSQGGQTFSYDVFKVLYGDTDLARTEWENFLNALNNDTSSPYYQTAMSQASVTLMPGYVASLYASGAIGIETFSGIIEYTDPNGNLYPSILEQMGLTDRYYNELDELNNPDDSSGYAEGDLMDWDDMSDAQKDAHALRRYIRTGEESNWYKNMTQDRIDAAYEYLKNDGDPALYGDQPGVNYTLNPETSTWNDIEEALIEAGYDQEFINDLLYHPENGLVHDRTNQNAVTLENILGELTGQIWDVLQLPTETDQISRVDMDGDGVYDTVVRCYKGSVLGCSPDDYQIVYGEDIDTTDPEVQEQIQNAVIFENAQATEGWEDLEDWEKNQILKDSGYTGPFVFGDGSTEPPLTPEEELERDYGAEAVQKATEIYNGIKDTIKGAIDDPIGTIKNILDNILPQIPEECINEGQAGVDYPDDWWKDCTTVSVLLPGLNIPLPPGMIDVNTTIRDLENAANEIGQTLEDIFNPQDDRTIGEILSDWANEVWESIKDAWEGLEEQTDAGLLNILIDMGYSILGPLIFSQIKETIIGNTNPFAFVQNCYDPEFAQQSTENQAFCDEALDQGALIRCADGSYRQTQAECAEGEFGFCEDGTTQKTDEEGRNCAEWGGEFGWCSDKREERKEDAEGTNCDGYVAPFDCSSVGREEPASGEKATSADDCGACLNPDFEIQDAGQCADPNALTETEQECANKGLKYDDLNDQCLDECVDPTKTPTGPNGECVNPPWTNPEDAPTEQDCANRGKTFVPADEANQKASECGDCTTEGWVHDGVGTNCYDPNPEPDPCVNNATTESECKECSDGSLPEAHINGDCNEDLTPTGPNAGDPCDSNGDGVEDGTLQANESGELECVTTSTGVQPGDPCDNAYYTDTRNRQVGPISGELDEDLVCRPLDGTYCENPGPGRSSIMGSIQNGVCVSGPAEVVCQDPNREVVYETGECGPRCLDGTIAPETGLCPEPVSEDLCQDGSTRDPNKGCREDWCDDAMTVPKNDDGTCPEGTTQTCPEGTPNAGQQVNNLDECGTTTTPQECANGATNYPLCTECADGSTTDPQTECGTTTTPQECANGATNYPLCTECADGSTTDINTPCGGVTETCANGAVDYPLCTECADGSLPDAELGCGTTPNPCDDAVFASENPLECGWVECPDGSFAPTEEQCGGGGCPEGQQPCEALGGECTTPENCPGGGGGGSGGGGGGGGGGMLEQAQFGMSGDPQLLSRTQFPITDYLAGLFKGIV